MLPSLQILYNEHSAAEIIPYAIVMCIHNSSRNFHIELFEIECQSGVDFEHFKLEQPDLINDCLCIWLSWKRTLPKNIYYSLSVSTSNRRRPKLSLDIISYLTLIQLGHIHSLYPSLQALVYSETKFYCFGVAAIVLSTFWY